MLSVSLSHRSKVSIISAIFKTEGQNSGFTKWICYRTNNHAMWQKFDSTGAGLFIQYDNLLISDWAQIRHHLFAWVVNITVSAFITDCFSLNTSCARPFWTISTVRPAPIVDVSFRSVSNFFGLDLVQLLQWQQNNLTLGRSSVNHLLIYHNVSVKAGEDSEICGE